MHIWCVASDDKVFNKNVNPYTHNSWAESANIIFNHVSSAIILNSTTNSTCYFILTILLVPLSTNIACSHQYLSVNSFLLLRFSPNLFIFFEAFPICLTSQNYSIYDLTFYKDMIYNFSIVRKCNYIFLQWAFNEYGYIRSTP